MSYPIAVVESVAETVLELRRTVRPEHAGDDIGGGLRELYTTATRMGLSPTGPPSTTYHGDLECPDGLRVVLGLPVTPADTEAGGDRIAVRATEPTMYVRTVHHGDYQRITAAYSALAEWMRTSGLRSAGPATEIYLVGPEAAVRTQDLATEIRVPVVFGSRLSVRLPEAVPTVVVALRRVLTAREFSVLAEVDIAEALGGEDAHRPHVLLTACLPQVARRVRALDPGQDRLLFSEFVIRGAGEDTVVEAREPASLPGDTEELVELARALRWRVAAAVRALDSAAPGEPSV